MSDEQHIPIKIEPPSADERHADSVQTAQRSDATDPVYTDLPGGEGVQSGEEGEMPTVTQTVEYGRFSETPCTPPTAVGPGSCSGGEAGATTAASSGEAGATTAASSGEAGATTAAAGGETSASAGSEPHAAGQAAEDGNWEEVVAALSVLGDSIGRWAKAAARDPNYERYADELKGALRGVAGKLTDAVDEVSRSEVAQGFREAAVRTGGAIYETGQRVYRDAVAPGLADAFRGAAEGLRVAAQRLEESRERAQKAAQAPVPPTSGEASETQGESVIEPPDPTEL